MSVEQSSDVGDKKTYSPALILLGMFLGLPLLLALIISTVEWIAEDANENTLHEVARSYGVTLKCISWAEMQKTNPGACGYAVPKRREVVLPGGSPGSQCLPISCSEGMTVGFLHELAHVRAGLHGGGVCEHHDRAWAESFLYLCGKHGVSELQCSRAIERDRRMHNCPNHY